MEIQIVSSVVVRVKYQQTHSMQTLMNMKEGLELKDVSALLVIIMMTMKNKHTNFGDEIYQKCKEPRWHDYAIVIAGIIVIGILIFHPHIMEWTDKMLYD